MSYSIQYATQFKKSLKRCQKRGLDIEKLRAVLYILSESGKLPTNYKPHKLSGKYIGLWECHIEPDWLLVWDQNDKQLTLLLIDTGSHSDIF
jgi:mRNA interferase YafQ